MAEQEKNFQIQKIYTKDFSFESPNSPQIFKQKNWDPNYEVNVQTRVQKVEEDGVNECVITITVTAKQGEDVAYLVEVQKAAIFVAQGFSEEEKGPMFGIFMPNTLFPYTQESISSIVSQGGFPEFVLQPINFEAMYAQHIQNQKKNTGETEH